MASNVIQMILKLQDHASKTLKDTAKSAADSNKEFLKLDKTTKAVTAGTIALAGAIGKMAKELADARNRINDTARATGVAASTIAGLDLAARGSGQSLETLTSGLRQLPKRIGDAQRGVGEAVVAFERLGLQSKIVNGELSTSDEVMRAFFREVSKISSPTEKAALAVQVFGEAGGNMMVALGDNAEAMDMFSRRAEVLGIRLGKDASEGADKFQRALADLETAAMGSMDRILVSLGLDEGGLADLITNFTAGLVTATTAIAGAFALVGNVMDRFIEGFINVTQLMKRELTDVAKLVKAVATFDVTAIASMVAQGRSPLESAGQIKDLLGESFEGLDIGKSVNKILANSISAGAFVKSGAGRRGTNKEPPTPTGPALPSLSANNRLTLTNQGIVTPTFADVPSIAAARRRDALRMLGRGAMGAGQGLAGLATGSVPMLPGPAGAAMGMLQTIGGQGASGVRSQLEGFTDAIVSALKELPTILGEVIPEFIIGFVQEFIPALIENAPAILKALIIDLPLALAKALFGLPVTILKNAADKGRDVIGDLYGSGSAPSRSFNRVFGPGNASGGYVDRTGVRLVHQGNYITGSSGAASGTAMETMARQNGGGPTVVVQGSVYGVDDLIRTLEQRLGYGGGGYSVNLAR